MKKNSKLKGTRMFVRHNTTQKKRRTRESIVRQAKELKEGRWKVKIGRNHLWVKSDGINYDEIVWDQLENKQCRREEDYLPTDKENKDSC